MTSPEGLLFQTTYWPLRLFARYMKNGRLLNLGFTSDAYDGPTYPEWIQFITKPGYVDCVAMIVEEEGSRRASIRLTVLNRHPTADWNGKISFDGFEIESVESHIVYSDELLAKTPFRTPTWLCPRYIGIAARTGPSRARSRSRSICSPFSSSMESSYRTQQKLQS